MRKVYGALLAALGLLLLLRLANGNSMLQLAGVLLLLAGVAVAFLRHAGDSPAPPEPEPVDPSPDAVQEP